MPGSSGASSTDSSTVGVTPGGGPSAGTTQPYPLLLPAPAQGVPTQGNQSVYLDEFSNNSYPGWFATNTAGTVTGPTLITNSTICEVSLGSVAALYYAQSKFGCCQAVKNSQIRFNGVLYLDRSDQSHILGLHPLGETNPFAAASGGALPTDGVWFQRLLGTWACVVASGGVYQTLTPTYTGSNAAYDDYSIILEGPTQTGASTATVSFYINGNPVAQIVGTAAPTGFLVPGFGVYANAHTVNLYIDRLGRSTQGMGAPTY